ncbi:MAG: hypothetical protein V4474_01820 [Patescibacteria group bacterium]
MIPFRKREVVMKFIACDPGRWGKDRYVYGITGGTIAWGSDRNKAHGFETSIGARTELKDLVGSKLDRMTFTPMTV